ncbi:DUF3015 family protein [Vibrio sp. SCSIO 43136]|uniref:DUF3015 family protein n=1 Tax=Vibrio sp. SCSIO 43136 TaxID=2819101 RepID=UPI002075CB64|nr:DUF3015 family protein [Vibrio sp. SCSIO 43136]USD67238.1 DUF3015 family protein [Vibrio sp. SCSIO 43136]
MKKMVLCSLVATVLCAGNVLAEEKKASINPWTQCGIGAMIFNDTGAAAAISNVIWDLGTTAVSSNISSQNTCEGSQVKAAMFIQDNYDQMIEQTSQGSGEHLTAMLHILEVDASEHSKVTQSIRSQMASKIVANESTPETYYQVVMASL